MKTTKGIHYLWYALDAFGGLGLEAVLAFMIEPTIYGHGLSEFTQTESIIHWIITCLIWGLVTFLILKSAEKKTDFSLKPTNSKITVLGLCLSILLVALVTVINIYDSGTLKIVHEFFILGPTKFIFQHIYYLFETLLFTLIIVFGQLAFETWFHNRRIPFGGIIVGLTWGLVHAFTKGSLFMGLEGLLIGFLFGSIYLFLNHDVKKTYVVLALAFIL